MKKFLLLMLTTLLFAGCSNSNEPSVEPQNGKMYTVSLGLAGEITSIINSPLKSKTASDDLYGIQVYSKPKDNVSSYSPYAYGLFDDISNLSINLLDNYVYKFVCTTVVNGKNKILSFSGFCAPFNIGNVSVFSATAFTCNSNEGFNNLSRGFAILQLPSGTFDIPNTDRYYGETSDYTPAVNSSVKINMKRGVFGIKVIADGLSEGSMNLEILGAPKMSIIAPATEAHDIFTFKSLDGIVNDGISSSMGVYYSESITLSATWVKSDGTSIPLVTNKSITVTRAQETEITIKVSGQNSKSNNLSISKDVTAITTGQKITIDQGNVINTPVTPTK